MPARLLQTIKRLVVSASEWVYPPRCIACGSFARELFCPKCDASLRFLDGPVCPSCGRELPPGAAADRPCSMCGNNNYNFTTCRSALHYEGPAESVLKKFKFNRRSVYADVLVAAMVKHLRAHPERFAQLGEADFAAPVPLHFFRLLRRGFNQSQLLAAGVARELKLPVRQALRRRRNTRPQSRMGWKERRANVRGAFAARRGAALEGKRVLLVDDVVTSGATVSECARALKDAGAAEVHVFTLARRHWE